ncbi:putative transcription factor gsfR1 [Trichoderma ghanense]|uniref:Transcription factor gsfR1 n=1 Tax=Trichoderma ghanense TaxID=65468 RepID=A0ABY2GV74_9HYPO
MSRSSAHQKAESAMSPPQLRRVRKGTRSCWECTSRTVTQPTSHRNLPRRRRKIRCSFQPGNPATCTRCISHNLVCVSQRFRDEASDASRNESMEERMMRMEDLLGRVLEKLEAASTHPSHPTKESPGRPETADDGIGIDVVNARSTISNLSSTSAVVSIFKNTSFMSEIGGEKPSSTPTPTTVPDINQPTIRSDDLMWPKLTRVSRILLEMMPSRSTMELLDHQSSPWICQLLGPLPSLKHVNKFSLLKMMPLESSTPSHPTFIARALMCIVICLQQLPPSVDSSQLRLPSARTEYMQSLTSVIISLVTSDDEIIATQEGLECLLLLSIYFVNSGRPRRAWLNNRRATAIAQLMDLHRIRDDDDNDGDELEGRSETESNLADLWPHIVHHDRYLSQILGFPCGVADSYEPFVPSNLKLMQHLDERKQDAIYQAHLDRIAALLIEREQRASTAGTAITQTIDNALVNLAASMPSSWWHPFDRLSGTQEEAMDMLYGRYNIQLWHHQLEMSNHLPFMLDAAEETRSEYSRIACLKAARQLIKVYLPLRTTFGMFSCCVTNFQAFTAAVVLIFNMFLRTPAAELEALSGRRERDWELIADVVGALDAAVERFEDRVALQARDVLRLLQAIETDPRTLQGDRFHFTIPYFGIISIARKTGEKGDGSHGGDNNQQMPGNGGDHHQLASAGAELYVNYSPTFMTTIDFMGPSTAADVDELMQQWLVENE